MEENSIATVGRVASEDLCIALCRVFRDFHTHNMVPLLVCFCPRPNSIYCPRESSDRFKAKKKLDTRENLR